MKKIIYVLLLFCFNQAISQSNPINIVNFSVKKVLPSNIETWMTMPDALSLTVQKNLLTSNTKNWTSRPGTQLFPIQEGPLPKGPEPVMVFQLRSEGSVLCGNNLATAKSLEPFEVRTFNTVELVSFLTDCKELKPGTYSLCVQFFSADKKELNCEACKEFIVEGQNMEKTPLQNISPADKKEFIADDLKAPLTFRWTPFVPKSKEPVTYRLNIWQMEQGQSAVMAMKSNQPIITKEVENLTETLVEGIPTDQCKPPYNCDFVWNVQALNREGLPLDEKNGISGATTFAVTQYIIQLDSMRVNCTNTPGVYSFTYYLTNPNPGPATLNLFTVTSSTPAGALIGTFTPPINTVISSGSQLTLTGTINAAPNLSNICIGAEIKDVGNAFWKASKDTCVPVSPCICNACDDKNFSFTAPIPEISFGNNTLSFSQSVSVSTVPVKTIKSITADIVYFEMVPENNLCLPCNKDSALYGHFNNSTNSMQWNGSQSLLNINITTPQLVPCCSATFRWCIRYKIEFTDCTSCSRLVCYVKRKEGCEKLTDDTQNIEPKETAMK